MAFAHINAKRADSYQARIPKGSQNMHKVEEEEEKNEDGIKEKRWGDGLLLCPIEE